MHACACAVCCAFRGTVIGETPAHLHTTTPVAHENAHKRARNYRHKTAPQQQQPSASRITCCPRVRSVVGSVSHSACAVCVCVFVWGLRHVCICVPAHLCSHACLPRDSPGIVSAQIKRARAREPHNVRAHIRAYVDCLLRGAFVQRTAVEAPHIYRLTVQGSGSSSRQPQQSPQNRNRRTRARGHNPSDNFSDPLHVCWRRRVKS